VRRLFWELYVAGDRRAALTEIAEIVTRHGAIVESSLFSDRAASLIVELAAARIPALRAALAQRATVLGPDDAGPEAEGDSYLFLTISFAAGTGDLRREIPRVPG